jgi:hypothetical protein
MFKELEDVDDDDVIYTWTVDATAPAMDRNGLKIVAKTGYDPPWIHQQERHLNGIGKTTTSGQREFYVNLEASVGSKFPGEITSTEVKGSDASMLLSIHAQQALGLVVDFGTMKIASKTLGIDFAAVRGQRNGLSTTMESNVIYTTRGGVCRGHMW